MTTKVPEKKKLKIGRPSIFTKKLGDTICKRLSEGESLRSICRDDSMPTVGTVIHWVVDGEREDFSQQYARARDSWAEIMAEEVIEISDNADKVVKSGAEKKSGAYSQNQRLRVDTRKWVLSKVLPKKYGDKLDLTSDGKALPIPILGGQSVTKKK